MPNHVKNILVIHAENERLLEILNDIKDDEKGIGTIDFNKLIPMPPSLDIESGSRTDQGFKMFIDLKEKAENFIQTLNNPKNAQEFIEAVKGQKEFEKNFNSMSDENKELFELGKRAFENIINYGAPTWYDWCINHWGTKWNAYDCSGEKNSLTFLTAWSVPEPVMTELSRKYPEIRMEHQWADEDIGVNLGQRIYLNGEIVEENIPEMGSKEAYDFAFRIWQEQPENYGLTLNADGTKYIEMEESEEFLLQSGDEDDELEE